jgi:Fe-Mn family superoxide dismutase
MPFEIMRLPYSHEALEPVMSSTTVEFHYNKHHKGYVKNLNELIIGTSYEDKTLDEVVIGSFAKRQSDKKERQIFQQAAQVWNHDLFWHSMSPSTTSAVTDTVRQALNEQFGSFDKFKDKFLGAAKHQFGSGWVWLICTPLGELTIQATSNAFNPLVMGPGYTPLLTCDVWEHAYYLDYQNKRNDMVEGFLDHLVNWTFVEKNLDRALNLIA